MVYISSKFKYFVGISKIDLPSLQVVGASVYLIYFAVQELWDNTLEYILTNHVLYATTVGVLFTSHLTFDNMATFNKLYINDKGRD